jgi:hypothetical protein
MRAQTPDASGKVTIAAGDAWLALLDDGHYEESWRAASSQFRVAITQAKWADAPHSARDPLGKELTRRVSNAKMIKHLPGAPDGQYAVLTYETRFEHKASAVETLTLACDAADWRAAGYFIR